MKKPRQNSFPILVLVVFLLFCGVSQKTVAAITNYTDRQVRNIRDQFENSNGDFPRGEEKRGRKKKSSGRIVKYIMDHPRSTLKDVAAFLKEELTRPLSDFFGEKLKISID